MSNLRRLAVTRYVTPLREGGSLPAIVEAEDEILYVAKFRGAGQGQRALVAELIGGELARTLGLRMPELVLLDLDESFHRTEPDQEIQDLLRFSIGLNLGMAYLPAAITYDPLVGSTDARTASLIVLLDSLITNIDRTARNTNLLMWENKLWVIDHGASLYFHHNWPLRERTLGRNFPPIKDHVLLEHATQLPEAADHLRRHIDEAELRRILQLIPDEWLEENSDEVTPAERRAGYLDILTDRLTRLEELAKEADHARTARI